MFKWLKNLFNKKDKRAEGSGVCFLQPIHDCDTGSHTVRRIGGRYYKMNAITFISYQ